MGTPCRIIDGVIINETNITIKASDGFPLAATLFSKDETSTNTVIVLGSALGVPRYIYFKLARFFARKGCPVLTFDYRGVHESQSDNVSGADIHMADWGKRDIDAALEWATNNLQPDELTYLGHSCGGQLLGMADHASKIDKAVFIASQSGYWKLWPIPQRWGVWVVWQLIPVVAHFFDDFPARTLRLSSVDIPSGVAQQWAQWGKSPHYLWDFISDQDKKRYQKLSFPLLSLSFADDHYFGPPKSAEKLLSYYPSTQSSFRIVTPSDYNRKSIGHFGFLKETFKDLLWQEILDWVNAN